MIWKKHWFICACYTMLRGVRPNQQAHSCIFYLLLQAWVSAYTKIMALRMTWKNFIEYFDNESWGIFNVSIDKKAEMRLGSASSGIIGLFQMLPTVLCRLPIARFFLLFILMALFSYWSDSYENWKIDNLVYY